MEDIKSCPFCGSDKIKFYAQHSQAHWGADGWVYRSTGSMRCNVCHARGSLVSSCSNKRHYSGDNTLLDDELRERAIEMWNNRS